MDNTFINSDGQLRLMELEKKVNKHGEDLAVIKSDMNIIKWVAAATAGASISTLISIVILHFF